MCDFCEGKIERSSSNVNVSLKEKMYMRIKVNKEPKHSFYMGINYCPTCGCNLFDERRIK